MQTITLHFDIEPKAKQSARHCIRGGHVHSYQKGEILDFENALAWSAKQQLPANFQMFTKIVHVEKLHFAHSPTNKVSRKAVGDDIWMYKTTKPDLPDNLSKAVFDALSKIVYADDSLIATMSNVAKFYSKHPYIEIILAGE